MDAAFNRDLCHQVAIVSNGYFKKAKMVPFGGTFSENVVKLENKFAH